MPVMFTKHTLLFIFLSGLFITNVLTAEFIGVKIFALDESLNLELPPINILGQKMQWQFTAGILLWPIVFVLTDIINDYFGVAGVKRLSYLASILILYAFGMVYIAIKMAPADWWVSIGVSQDISNSQTAYAFIFGQSNWIIIGSLIAFLVGQVTDAYIFKSIKKWAGEKGIWIRATVSTLISQFFDSYIVIYIAFVIGQGWSMEQFLQVSTMNYLFKFILAILLIPALLGVHKLIGLYLGKENAEKLQRDAMDS